jgi:hypothetical protein
MATPETPCSAQPCMRSRCAARLETVVLARLGWPNAIAIASSCGMGTAASSHLRSIPSSRSRAAVRLPMMRAAAICRSESPQWLGVCGVRIKPLADALQAFILGHAVVHADETPVALLAPGHGKTKRAFVWVYRTTNFVAQRAVLFDFCASRAGEHPRRVLKDFNGTLVTDDYSGYHKLQAQAHIIGALCMAHARRKLFEAHKLNGSQIAGEAVALIAKLNEVEREARELEPQARLMLRPSRAKPIADTLHAWLLAQRQTLAKSDVTAKAIDYSLSIGAHSRATWSTAKFPSTTTRSRTPSDRWPSAGATVCSRAPSRPPERAAVMLSV